jgi:hypothetical protein
MRFADASQPCASIHSGEVDIVDDDVRLQSNPSTSVPARRRRRPRLEIGGSATADEPNGVIVVNDEKSTSGYCRFAHRNLDPVAEDGPDAWKNVVDAEPSITPR